MRIIDRGRKRIQLDQGFGDPVIVYPGANDLPAPNDISHSSWTLRGTSIVTNGPDFFEITNASGSGQPRMITVQSAPRATMICDFQAAFNTNVIEFLYTLTGQYGVEYNFGTDDLRIFDPTKVTAQRERLADGWVRIRMDSTSTSGLHDNFSPAISGVDRNADNSILRFRNPYMHLN